jgi:hypothetical protein
MNNTNNRKKSITAALGAAAAAVAAPAMLFLGTGTAHAVDVQPQADYLGVTVHIKGDNTFKGSCTYTAIPQPGFVGVPVIDYGVELTAFQTTDLWFPGVKLNQQWNTWVRCGGNVHFSPETY